jgi:SCP-2 sterol transfer family
MTASLMAGLLSFQSQVNAHTRMASLLKGWNPTFHLECTDTGLLYSLRVKDGRVDAVAEGHVDAAHTIRLLAREADLEALFTGRLHPVQAHSDGVLEVYGDSKDQVKLDAITMVLWNV